MTTDMTDLVARAKDMLSPELKEMVNQISTRKNKGRKDSDTQQQAQASTRRAEVCEGTTA